MVRWSIKWDLIKAKLATKSLNISIILWVLSSKSLWIIYLIDEYRHCGNVSAIIISNGMKSEPIWHQYALIKDDMI